VRVDLIAAETELRGATKSKEESKQAIKTLTLLTEDWGIDLFMTFPSEVGLSVRGSLHSLGVIWLLKLTTVCDACLKSGRTDSG
jgi:hypothetical protein